MVNDGVSAVNFLDQDLKRCYFELVFALFCCLFSRFLMQSFQFNSIFKHFKEMHVVWVFFWYFSVRIFLARINKKFTLFFLTG